MLGAIVGDIAGSRFEWDNLKSKDFDLLTHACFPTDDSNMTLAVAAAILACKGRWGKLSAEVIRSMRKIGRQYPEGFGSGFRAWVYSESPEPYNSWGNGAAMRVSPCAWAAKSLDEALKLAESVTAVTHNHPEGLKGAAAVTAAIYLARTGSSILEIRDYIADHYYKLDFTIDGIRPGYVFDVSCQGSVPQAIEAFLESTSFEDAIRNAVSIGGDSDTIAAIAGSIAEAYYGIPAALRDHALTFLDAPRLEILNAFEAKYGIALEKAVAAGVSRVAAMKPVTQKRGHKRGVSREEQMLLAVDRTDAAAGTTEDERRKLKATKLFNHLFQACNILRGPINQDEFKSYVIPILFLKRISDCYDEETRAAEKKYGPDVALYSEEELHPFKLPNGHHWNDIKDKAEDIGKAIVDAMMEIENANSESMAGLFSSFDDANWEDKNKLSDEVLHKLVDHMSSVSVGNEDYSADIMGDAYEYLLKKFADLQKKNAGEFYTPRTIVKLMVEMLAPKPGETVYDPACGTGGMLIEAIRQIGGRERAYGRIFGQEKNLSTSAIARMNLFLHGAQEFAIQQGDTLRNPQFKSGGKLRIFDCVLANPPFGLSGWGAAVFEDDQYGRCIWGVPPDSNADYAWLQHMTVSMKPKTGRCAVVMPQGVLFHGGKEGAMRQKMIESDALECVINLVGGVFFGAGVSACILYFNNNKPATHRGKVCLIDATKIYTAKRAQNEMSEADIARVYKLWMDYADVKDYVKIVSLDDLAAHDFTLAVNTYVEKTAAKSISPEETRRNFAAALKEVEESESALIDILKEEGYLHV